MTESIYAPPETDVDVAEPQATPFYVVSIQKFVILNVLTLGLYIVYWAYRNWANYKRYYSDDVIPLARAFFLIFFLHALLGAVEGAVKSRRPDYRWFPMLRATAVVVLVIASRIIDRIAAKMDQLTWLDFAVIASVLVTTAILVPAQRAINIACDDPDGSSNARYTVWNWLWILLGGAVWLLMGLGFFVLYQASSLPG